MKDGQCIKCGKVGHIGRNCRTGWKYDAASGTATSAEFKGVTTIERKRPASTQERQQSQKRRLVDEPDKGIKNIASRFEELSDSGND